MVLKKVRNSNFLMQTTQPQVQEVWIRVLKKGIVTLPKAMREKVGIKEGDVAKAKLVGNNIIIEPRETPYEGRIFTDAEIAQWKKDDELLPEMAKETEQLVKEAFPDRP